MRRQSSQPAAAAASRPSPAVAPAPATEAAVDPVPHHSSSADDSVAAATFSGWHSPLAAFFQRRLAFARVSPRRGSRRQQMPNSTFNTTNAWTRAAAISSWHRDNPAVMAQSRPEVVEEVSEERTEPFSQSEIDTRLNRITVEEAGGGPLVREPDVPLDVLQVEDHHHRQGIRILVRPLTALNSSRSVSPGADNCQWLALRAEVASSDQPEHKVLAVTQTPKDIKFTVRIPGETQEESSRPPLWCELYYDPASDRVIFLNRSDVPISLSKVARVPTVDSPPSPAPTNALAVGESHIINPGLIRALRPGTWRIKVRDAAVLDFRVLEKRPTNVYPKRPALPQGESSQASSKRALSPDEGDDRRVRRRVSDAADPDDNVIVFLGPKTDPLAFALPSGQQEPSREIAAANGHALLDAERDETVVVPGVCELDEYSLTKRDLIASTALSAVYTAQHSHISDNIVTVKVLKTRMPNVGDKPQVHERNVIRQADMWLRESQSQEDLQHESIVRYYGGDARYLSLYMEHVDAPDLTSGSRWRNRENDLFVGSREDGRRILRDIAGALAYMHGRQLVHNDIKPANILYSPERGAVLCDFGLSTPAATSPSGGGTPYYVPPEFIGQKKRGPASDVWALGITMLYVLGKVTFPDSRARRNHRKPLYWLINCINNPNLPHKQGNGLPAATQMREWLTEVFDARDRLDSRDRLEKLVREMLTPNPNQRITMSRVLQEVLQEPAAIVS